MKWEWKCHSLIRVQFFATPWTVQQYPLLCPCNSPGKNIAVGSHSLLQRIFLTQGWNPDLLQRRWILYQLSQQGAPMKKFECQIIDIFELWCWRRLFRVSVQEFKSVNPKRNQSWIFIGRTDAEAKAPVLWLHDVKCQFIGKDPDPGKGWRPKEKEVAEDEMFR